MDKLDTLIDGMQDELIAAIQENVRVPSVEGEPEKDAPYGKGPKAAMKSFLDIAGRLGFETGSFENMVGWADYGDSDAEMVCVLGHVDVVPEGDGWKYPPYGAEIHDGKLYGRGVLDDKGPVLCALFALKAIREAGISLSKRVRVLVGTNEETGSKAVKRYVESGQELPVAGFTPDAEYPLINGEKGILICECDAPFAPEGDVAILSMKGGVAHNVVPAHCEAVLRVKPDLLGRVRYTVENWKGAERATASLKDNGDGTVTVAMAGVSAHGSRPEDGVNAIAWLVKLLRTLGIGGEQGDFLKAVDDLIGVEAYGESLGICLYDEVSHYTSLCWGTIESADGRISFTINPRYPVTFHEEDVLPVLKGSLEERGISMKVTQRGAPLFMAEDSELVQKLMKVYREKTGRDDRPMAIGGGTYAKAMPNILAFGPVMPGEPANLHEANECWAVENIIANTRLMGAAILELAR